MTAQAHQPQHDKQQRQPECGAERGAFCQIRKEDRLRHPVEAEPLFDDELAVVIERQIDNARHDDHGGDQRDLARIPLAEPGGNQAIEYLDAAEQRQADQQRRADDDFEHRQARAHDRVVSRAPMCCNRDRFGELSGHRVPVRRHEADLSGGQPQFRGDHRDYQDGEQNGEVESGHREVQGNYARIIKFRGIGRACPGPRSAILFLFASTHGLPS